MKIVAIALAAVFLSSAFASGSKLIEEQRRGSAKRAGGAMGREAAQDIVVTVFLDDTAPQPYPLLVLNHGRSWDPAAHEGPGVLTRERLSGAVTVGARIEHWTFTPRLAPSQS